MKKSAAVVGGLSLGTLATVALALPGLPSTPGEVITWIDAFSELISRMGMPGTIVILLALIGYGELWKIPRKEAKAEEEKANLIAQYQKRIDDLTIELQKRINDEFTRIGRTQVRLEKLVHANTRSNVRINETLSHIYQALDVKENTPPHDSIDVEIEEDEGGDA